MREACPLCAAPLAAEQEWCLSCGAAARTRLAAAPAWRGPVVAIAVLAALALGVIAAALVKLAGDSGPAPAPITRTLTTAASAVTTVPTTTIPGAGVPATTATVPSTTTSTPAVTGGLTVSTAAKALPPAKTSGGLAGIGSGKTGPARSSK